MSRRTSEMVNDIVEAATTGEHDIAAAGAVKTGRRTMDWRAIFSFRGQVSIFFYVFGMFLDERHKPSMSRIMLSLWTVGGWFLLHHELVLKAGEPPISNACWQAWWAAEGVLCLTVFGPSIASYFGPGAAGAVAGGSIGSSVRDAVREVQAVAEKVKVAVATPPAAATPIVTEEHTDV